MRPLSSAVISQSQTLAAQNTTPVALLPQMRSFQTTAVTRDIDSAAKFIGAGAATVGCAGSGTFKNKFNIPFYFQFALQSKLIDRSIRSKFSQI